MPGMFLGLPWATLAGVFAVNVARGGDHFRGGLAVFFGMFFVTGVQRVGGRLLRPADGHPASMSALDLTGVIAALTVVFLAGGQATIRRVTV
jgi:hypothetical protein